MFRFEHPNYLFALGLLPIFALLFYLFWQWHKSAMRRFGNPQLLAALMPEASGWKHPLKFAFVIVALAFLVVGWANPQWGTKRDKTTRKSADVFIALDISNSMLAQDVPPSRLERAKKFAEDLVEKLKGERIGIILFAGGAYMQMPLTTDYAAAQLFLRSANTEQAGTQGTAIGEAINLANRSFPPDNKTHKALIIISDGEDHDGEALSQAGTASDDGMLIFTVGAGTANGGLIPLGSGRRQDFKRDAARKPIRTKLNESMMQHLAERGGGEYFHITRSFQVAEMLQKGIDKLEKKERETQAFQEHESYFQLFIGIALLLLAIEFLISYKKRAWEGKDIFE